MALANAAVVLAKGDIQHPVDRVFNPSVCVRSGQKQFGVGREAGDEVASFKRGVLLQLPFRFDHNQALELRPHHHMSPFLPDLDAIALRGLSDAK